MVGSEYRNGSDTSSQNTINVLFGADVSNEIEMEDWLNSRRVPTEKRNGEESALARRW